MGTTNTIEMNDSEQVIAELGAIVQQVKDAQPEEPAARKVVPLSEVQAMLGAALPELRTHIEGIVANFDLLMSFARSSRVAGDNGLLFRLQTWGEQGFPSICQDLVILISEFQSWENTVALEVEIRDLKKQLAAKGAAEKQAAKAANAAMVTGDKPAAKSKPAAAAEAPKPVQRRNRKAATKAEEPVAA